jgi:3',5'-nucleoside bisphosphate phosphatase
MTEQKITIDMHVHSTYSDGEDSPVEIVRKAHDRNLEIISMTDHDIISGLQTAREEARKLGIGLVNGIELRVSVYISDYKEGKKPLDIDLLGYGFDDNDVALNLLLDEHNAYRRWRSEEMIRNLDRVLCEEGIFQITPGEFEMFKRSITGYVGRPHLARLLVRKGIVSSEEEAFSRYMVKCDVPKKEISLEAGSQLIRQAGGEVYMAHPHGNRHYSLLKVTKDIQSQKNMIRSMIPYLDGIECFHSKHTPEQSDQYVGIARELGLRISGGSDHHGGKERDLLGRVYVPAYVGDNFKRMA